MDIVGCCQHCQHQSCNVLRVVRQTAIKWRVNSPLAAISSIDMPRSWAMNPSIENTAKPAKILVALFKQHSTTQSLQQNKMTTLHWQRVFKCKTVTWLCTERHVSMWVRSLTCSSCCCIGCSLLEQSVPPDRQRRRRTPESPRHATPVGGKILSFEIFWQLHVKSCGRQHYLNNLCHCVNKSMSDEWLHVCLYLCTFRSVWM